MNFKILQKPDSSGTACRAATVACVTLNAGEQLIAESGCMIAMNSHLNVSTTLRQGKGGGVLGGLKRMLGGESIFLSVFRSPVDGSEIYIAPKLMGDILPYQITGSELIVQAGSYLACESTVDIDLGFQGFKSFFSGESLFWLTISGYGLVLLTSFGAIYEVPVNGEYVVDTGHIVAFEKSLNFEITKPGSSWIGAFLGKEGLVCRFKGQGRVFCQTHNPGAFGQLIGSQLPAKNS